MTMSFLGGSGSEDSACNAGDFGSIPGWEASSGEGIGYPLQYSWYSLMFRRCKKKKNPPAMWETWVRSLGGEDPLEGGGHDNPLQYSSLENPHGQRSLAGYSPWGCKKSDTTERLIIAYSTCQALFQALLTHFILTTNLWSRCDYFLTSEILK